MCAFFFHFAAHIKYLRTSIQCSDGCLLLTNFSATNLIFVTYYTALPSRLSDPRLSCPCLRPSFVLTSLIHARPSTFSHPRLPHLRFFFQAFFFHVDKQARLTLLLDPVRIYKNDTCIL